MKTLLMTILFGISFTTNAADTKESSTGPAFTCAKLVEAAKANKFDEFQSLTTNYGPKYMMKKEMKPMAAQKFDKMHTEFMDKIKGINCGTEHIAGTNAFVEAETNGTKRFIPFIKVEDNWKFDAKTYMSFYNVPKQGPKGKGMHQQGM